MNQYQVQLRSNFIGLFIFMVFSSLILVGCGGNNNSTPSTPTSSLDGYTISNLGQGVELARAYKNEHVITEEGHIVNGKKNGTWVIYHEDNGRIQTMQSYANDLLNGPAIEFDQRGQMIKRATYKNNVLEGIKAEYKYGRPVIETPYVNGKINGMYKEFYQNGKIQKEVEYKNGKLDGIFRQYTDDGKMTLDYTYKNGEKVSGSIIE